MDKPKSTGSDFMGWNLFGHLKGAVSGKRAGRRPPSRSAFRPRLESLEDRTAPSAFASMTGAAEKFGVYEVVLTGNGSVANPFDTKATVTWTAPSGQAFTVDDFYAGGDTWRARTYVTEAGLWHWAASSAADPGL